MRRSWFTSRPIRRHANLPSTAKRPIGNTKQLFAVHRLSTEFVRFRLTVVPQSDVVNLQINDEDQGTFTYPVYARHLDRPTVMTISADTSSAEFDYVDVRSGTN